MPPRDDKVDTWMPWYVRDFLAATAGLTAEAAGAYARLLSHLWLEHGSLDDDQETLQRLAGASGDSWPDTWKRIRKFFDITDGRVSQKRLSHELEQARSLRMTRSMNGKAGAASRRPAGSLSGTTRSERLAAARKKGTHTGLEWLALVQEFGGRCVRCGRHGHNPEKDHIVPLYQGGSDGIDNIQPVCARCNASKGPEDVNWADYRRVHGFEATPPERLAKRSAKRLADATPSPSPSPSPTPAEGDPDARARAPSLFPWALGAFCAAWGRRYGVDYAPTARDRSQLGRLLQSLSPEQTSALPACFSAYTRDEDRFLAEIQRHSLSFFCTSGGVNKYRVTAPILSAKEARTATAVERFIQGGIDGRHDR